MGHTEINCNDGSTVTVGEELDGNGVLFIAFEDNDDTFNLFVDKAEWEKIKATVDAVFVTGRT